MRALTAELYFFGKVFGFEPAGEIEPIGIAFAEKVGGAVSVAAEDDAGVLLGDEGSPADAQRLVQRLIIEGVGAVAQGSQVWVRPEDQTHAFVLARLFAEVDRGTSKVAPPL